MSQVTELDVLKSIDRKIDGMRKLIARSIVKDMTPKEQVKLLDSIGMTSPEIGSCLDISPITVRVHLHQIKAKVKKGGKSGK